MAVAENERIIIYFFLCMFEGENRVKLIEMIDPKTKNVEKYQMELKMIGQGKYGKVYKATHIDRL